MKGCRDAAGGAEATQSSPKPRVPPEEGGRGNNGDLKIDTGAMKLIASLVDERITVSESSAFAFVKAVMALTQSL